MSEQDNTLTLISKEEMLDRRKNAVMNLITEMTETMPPMAQVMIRANLGTVHQFVDNLTWEQTEEILDRVQNVLDTLRG